MKSSLGGRHVGSRYFAMIRAENIHHKILREAAVPSEADAISLRVCVCVRPSVRFRTQRAQSVWQFGSSKHISLNGFGLRPCLDIRLSS